MPPTVPTAVVTSWGTPPEILEMPAPAARPGHTLVELLAAGVNPVDLAVGGGRFYMPLPDPPFTAGVEAVGRVVQSDTYALDTHVWCLQPTGGCWSGVFSAPDDRLVPVAHDADPVTAAAMGVAGLAGWMPVVMRGRVAVGETVLVLGATGAVGQVAVQAARARGAGRVVAVGRDPERLGALRGLGADDVVEIGDGAELGARIAAACPERINLVIDALWGEPMAATVASLAPGARVVQVGSASGQTCTLPGGPLRGGRIDIRGFSVFSEPREQLSVGYTELVRMAGEGAVNLPVDTVPLAQVDTAWEAQKSAGGRKLVLIP